MISTRAKALKYSNRSGPFLRRDLAPYYSAIDRRARSRLSNRFSISSIIFLTFDKGFHILWWDQPNLVAQTGNLTAPIMGASASLQRDQTAIMARHVLQYT